MIRARNSGLVFLFSAVLGWLILVSCTNTGSKQYANRSDSIPSASTVPPFKPGFGEFMSSIQVHHEKLYFAGKNANWALADFEIHEIGEALDNLKIYCTDRPETAKLPMITPALDSIAATIARKDSSAFFHQFTYLTQACNDCHQATDHGFNRIVIPTRPPFSNQDFNPVDAK
jgi:hypothetical protein